MFLQFENAAVVGANALEYSVAIKQPVVENGNSRVLLIVVPAVNIDFHAVKCG